MKVGALKKSKPYASKTDKSLHIQTFGEKNDFPQDVMWITLGSSTGLSCINVFSKFLSGRGFADKAFYDVVVNRKRQTNDKILRLVSTDYARYLGGYIHVNYNMNYRIKEIQWIPFENVRLGELNDAGVVQNVAVHWDWAKQFTQIKKWSKEDIDYIDVFNPDPDVIQAQVDAAGGWGNYKGQVYIICMNENGGYPLPIYFPTLTDMSTEQGISNLSYRNARNNFLPAGMLIDIVNSDESKEQAEDTENDIIEFQGDEEACNIMYTSVKSKEEIPAFVPFESKNYDKEFTVTDESCRGRIGRSFNQPPILRAEDVGSNFGADALQNAYDYYNSVTEVDRMNIESAFQELFQYWHNPIYQDFSILKLTYLDKNTIYEKLGEAGTKQVLEIVNNPEISPERKKNILTTVFGLTPEEADTLLV